MDGEYEQNACESRCASVWLRVFFNARGRSFHVRDNNNDETVPVAILARTLHHHLETHASTGTGWKGWMLLALLIHPIRLAWRRSAAPCIP